MENYFGKYKKVIDGAIDQDTIQTCIDMIKNSVRLTAEEKEDLMLQAQSKLSELSIKHRGKVRNFAKKNWKTLALTGLVLTTGIGGYALGKSNSGVAMNDSNQNVTVTNLDKLYAPVDKSLQSFNSNVNDELVENLSEFRAENIEKGISIDEGVSLDRENLGNVDSANLVRFALAMNMNGQWDERDIAAMDGIITTVEDLDRAFLNQAHIYAEDFATITSDTTLDWENVISSNKEREPIEQRQELWLQYIEGKTDAEREEATAKLNDLITKTWTTDTYTKYSAQTMYFVSLLDDEMRAMTINAAEGQQVMTDDVFRIASEGMPIDNDCEKEVKDEIEKARGQEDYSQVVSSTLRGQYRKAWRDQFEKIENYQEKIEEGTFAVPEEENETFDEIIVQINELTDKLIKENGYKYVANPSRDDFRNSLDVSGAQIPSNLGDTPVENGYAIDKVIGNPNGGSGEVISESPITLAPGIVQNPDGSFSTEDGHNITINPGGGAYDPDIPMYDPNEAEDNLNQDPTVDFEPLPEDDQIVVDDNGNQIQEDENHTFVDGGNQVEVDSDGNAWVVEEGDALTPEEEQAIRDQIQAELDKENANAPVTPTTEAIQDLEQEKAALLEASQNQVTQEVTQGGMQK